MRKMCLDLRGAYLQNGLGTFKLLEKCHDGKLGNKQDKVNFGLRHSFHLLKKKAAKENDMSQNDED